ncbi:hypothetical protein [Nonomuraea basaltis]|uniref:hypothetical protein n=1 Tax=Nonomuraea basaltis TaxID=2495887 RepID=UPI001486457B|nr:hypothetical protein [Nonomuraea basaltis]
MASAAKAAYSRSAPATAESAACTPARYPRQTGWPTSAAKASPSAAVSRAAWCLPSISWAMARTVIACGIRPRLPPVRHSVTSAVAASSISS